MVKQRHICAVVTNHLLRYKENGLATTQQPKPTPDPQKEQEVQPEPKSNVNQAEVDCLKSLLASSSDPLNLLQDLLKGKKKCN